MSPTKWLQQQPRRKVEPGGSPLTDRYAVSAASVIGREHVRLLRNNQDGYSVSFDSGLFVGVVADGCSGGPYSEVGARYAARWLATWIPEIYYRCEWNGAFSTVVHIYTAFLEALTQFRDSLCSQPGQDSDIVREYLLFTFLVTLMTPEQTVVFGIGDGAWSVNGHTHCIDPGPNNAPPYIGYGLVPPETMESHPGWTGPVIHYCGPTVEVDSVLIATDGLGDLERTRHKPLKNGNFQGGMGQFERDTRYTRLPRSLRKRLNVLGDRNHRLPDDTTVVLIQRRGDES